MKKFIPILLAFVIATLVILSVMKYEKFLRKPRPERYLQESVAKKQDTLPEYQKIITYYSQNKIDPSGFADLDITQNPVILQSFDQMGKIITFNSWNSLRAELPDFKVFFPVIWIPPLTKSTGKPGYIPLSYTDLNSYWGTEAELAMLARAAKSMDLELMADMVFHHSENPYFDMYDAKTNTADDFKDKKWFETQVVSPRANDIDYIPLWMTTNFAKGNILDQNNFVKYENYGESCISKNADGLYQINANCVPTDSTSIDCSKVLPMYTFNADVMDGGGLQALNMCNLEILENQVALLNHLYSMGITSFRYDQVNGMAPYTMKLFNNSNINKTAGILTEIIEGCRKSRAYPRCNQVYVNQIEDQATALLKQTNQLQRFTTLGHRYAVGEVFTPTIDKKNVGQVVDVNFDPHPDKTWYSLVGELEDMNAGLDKKDMIGVFDFGLRSLMKSALVPDNSSFTIDNTQWKDLMNKTVIGYGNQKYTRNYPCLAYTFADNHDTDYMLAFYDSTNDSRGAPSGLPYNRLILGYFIMLMMPGYPVVYNFHYKWFKSISSFLILRQVLGIRYDSLLEIPQMYSQNYIIWKVTSQTGVVYTFVILDVNQKVNTNLNDDKLIFRYPLVKTENIEMRIYSDSGFKPVVPGTPTVNPGGVNPASCGGDGQTNTYACSSWNNQFMFNT